ncbi:hypothetical protein C5167_010325 [Papaver somniferum]|uniref:Aminotransferase-like plant mobile domain-containing protein n=1 Tax=Papaver somniferum TaxID=3469 RepID=A0A4Y7K2S8_PAPSO|nr:hypothetical protein C5167_010325 [Papaver somniferum]
MITSIRVGVGAPVPLGVNMTEENVRNILGPHCGDIFPKNWYVSLADLKMNFSVPELDLVAEASKDNAKVIEVSRAFLIFVAGHTFLRSSSGYIKSGYLAAFSDFDLAGFYDWGSCAMARLYNYLTRPTRLQTKALCGFWHVLNYWCYEYFPTSLPPFDTSFSNSQTFPRMARWKGALRIHSTAYTRLCLEEICCDPWKNYLIRRDQRAIHAMSPSMLRYLLRGPNYYAWYLGDRFGRQISEPDATPRFPPPDDTCFTYASFSDMDEISRQSQCSYEYSIDRGLNFDSYWRSASRPHQEYLLRLVDSRERQLKSVMNEMGKEIADRVNDPNGLEQPDRSWISFWFARKVV